ncbi:MAG: immunoglobulin-like domain-containing protein [Solirubrobacterales bacterium]
MRARHLLVPPLAVLSLALAFAACGSDSGDNTGDGTDSSQPADAGLEVLVEPERAAAGDTVKAEVVNGTEEQFTYGKAFELERQEGEDFVKVKLPPTPTPMIALIAEPGETGPPIQIKLPKDLMPGQYRVVIQRDVPDVGDLSGAFEVTGDY